METDISSSGRPGGASDVVPRTECLLEIAEEEVRLRLRLAGRSDRTAQEYIDEARTFGEWLRRTDGRRATLDDLEPRKVNRYLHDASLRAEGRGRPWTPDTFGHHMRQLRAFAGHVAELFDLGGNPLAGMLIPNGSGRSAWVGDALEDDQMLALVDSLDRRGGPHRVTLGIIALGYEDGPRTSELCAMEVPDARILEVHGRALGPVVTVRRPAKNGPQRVLPLGVRAEDMIARVVGRRTEGPLFPARDGGFVTEQRLRAWISAAGHSVGIAGLTPQRLRRSAASWQETYGAGSGHLDVLFGWKPDPRDVKSGHYTRPTATQLLYAHQTRLSPLDRLEHRAGPLPIS